MNKILVVDDELGIRTVLSTALQNDYDVSVAASGLEALDMLAKVEPKLVLLDIDMPGMNGLEVLNRIQATNLKPCVIMLTTIEKLDTAKRALALGACEYITKPFDVNQLRNIIAAKLNAGERPDQNVPWKVIEDK